MIPIKNKKKNLKVTVEEMRNFSFNYIEKYAPSKQQLRTYLLKKYIKSKIPNSRSATRSPIAKDFKNNVGSISKMLTSSKTPIGTIAL